MLGDPEGWDVIEEDDDLLVGEENDYQEGEEFSYDDEGAFGVSLPPRR